MGSNSHEPVLLAEVIDLLHVRDRLHLKKAHKYIDATLGAGGYTKAICELGGLVLSIDTDKKMIEIAKKNLSGVGGYKIAQGNFRNIAEIAKVNDFTEVSGIVFDLGVSSIHFLEDGRGFSFQDKEAPLDMRLDPESQGVKASDLLNSLREDQLSEVLGRNLSQKVVEKRVTKPFSQVGDLVDLIGQKRVGRIHPATEAFMALRIAVNGELENLKEALPQAYSLLRPGGKLIVVTFHSGEDRIVKKFMKNSEIVLPKKEEIERNPKARSAKLRCIEKF
ncbi:MAG: 16S rRNA (cytosine(1402)-N(4))-methyltransferase RsmH [Patescibacteria group bacterium]